jgi:tetratricopeptide (TPR) repeat protein/predicted Ser/Thr protein kinase
MGGERGDTPDEARTRIEGAERSVIAVEPMPSGRLVDRYTFLRELGRGGMGTVYSAYDEQLDRKVAIKLLRQLASGSLGAPRLLGEAQALAALSHPNVVQVYDVGLLGEQVFLAMEYVQGETLRAWQEAKPRHWRETLAIYRQAGEGLAAAHAAGLVHRDVKPDNLMIGRDGRVRVMDFGLARRRSMPGGDDPSLMSSPVDGHTHTRRLTGTPVYMPPEQLRGESIDAAADTFAFCVSFWEALHGARPFAGATIAALRENLACERIVEPPADRPTPRWLRDALLRGLAADPARRWPSMAALLAALDRGLTRARRRRSILAIGGLVVFVVALGLAGLWWQRADLRARIADCAARGGEVEAIWNEPARARLREAMLTSRLPFAAATAERVLPRLDAWSAQWTRVRIETCSKDQVEHGWSADLRARADDCLEERLLGFSALVSELSTGDADMVKGAIDAAAGLIDASSCGAPHRLARRPALPEVGLDRLQGLRVAFARAAALKQAGKYVQGEALAREALVTAEALAWAPALAEARLWIGVFEESLDKHEAAAKNLEHAYFAAARASALETVTDAALALSLVVGHGLRHQDEGLRWSRHAELGLLGLESDGRTPRDVEWLTARGLIRLVAGEHQRSLEDFTAALALAETVLGAEHPAVVLLLANLAIAEGQVGQLERARASAARALALAERVLGPEHPSVATAASTLATRSTALARGLADPAAADREYAQAVALLTRALTIRERAFGPDDSMVAETLNTLAQVRFFRGEVEGIEAAQTEAVAILERSVGPDDHRVAYCLAGLGLSQDAFGKYSEARQTHERALAIRRRAFPAHHPDIASSMNSLGLVHLHLGDLRSARPLIEEAHAIRRRAFIRDDHPMIAGSLRTLALLEALSGDLPRARAYLDRAAKVSTLAELAEARLALAQATWDQTPQERAGAVGLAEQARDGFVSGGKRTQRWRVAAEAWLTDHALP